MQTIDIASIIDFLLASRDNIIIFCVRKDAISAEQAVLKAGMPPCFSVKFNRASIINSDIECLALRFNDQHRMGPQLIYNSDPVKLLKIVNDVTGALIDHWKYNNVEFIGLPDDFRRFLATYGGFLIVRVLDGYLIFEYRAVAEIDMDKLGQ